MRAILALFCIAACSWAQEDEGRIEGRVVSTDGSPVAKAAVQVRNQARTDPPAVNYSAITDQDGRFFVEGVVPGTYTPFPQHADYTPPNIPESFPVQAGTTSKGILLKMTPLPIVSGTVTDEAGKPVAGATVQMVQLNSGNSLGRILWGKLAGVSSGADGRFVLRASRGQYYLTVTNADSPQAGTGGPVNLPTYYPLSPDTRAARVLDLEAGNVEGLQLRMLRGRMYTIRGTLTLPENHSAAFTISVASKYREPLTGAQPPIVIQPDGQFQSIPLPPGEYTVYVISQPTSTRIAGRTDVTITDANVEGVRIRARSDLTVTGRITLDGVKDLPSFLAGFQSNRVMPPVTVPRSPPPQPNLPSLQLIALENFPPMETSVQIAQDGTFRVSNLMPMKYGMTFGNLPPATFATSVRLNGAPVTTEFLDLSSGVGGTLEIALSFRTGSLAFTSPAGWKPPTQASNATHTVSVWSVDPVIGNPNAGIWVATMNTLQAGQSPQNNARVTGLAPGEYYVVLWEELPSGLAVRSPEFLRQFKEVASRILIRENEVSIVEPKLISREEAKKAAGFP